MECVCLRKLCNIRSFDCSNRKVRDGQHEKRQGDDVKTILNDGPYIPIIMLWQAAMLFLLLRFLLGCAPLLAAAAQPAGTAFTAAPPVLVSAPFAASPALLAAANAVEQAALLALRAHWQDPQGHLASWNASSALPLCSWRGITCTNSSISALYLSALSLSGSLSSAIANLSSLSLLNLSYNNLTGLIPAELASLPSLSRLHLSHNSFNGTIPPSLFLSHSLQFLLLENNLLSGQVPSSIANLAPLRYLSLQSNSFTGPIPPSIANLTKLSAIFLGSNRFNGTIPLQIGNLHRLIYLDLQNNLLTGPIPSSIGSLTHLKSLALRNNHLLGPLPPELGLLHDAIAIDLSSNFLNGSIPPEIGSLSSLQTLDLHENDLTGLIPASLGNLTMLKSLNLSYNNLSGEVPTNGILGNFSATSFVGNELLCGGPMLDFQCYMPPQTTSAPPRDYMKHRMPPYEQESQLGKNGKITIAVVVGVVGLVVVIVFLALCSCCKRGQEGHAEEIPNSFSMDVQDSMRKAKLEIYMQGFTHNYEEIVSRAGFYDTAHVIGKGRFATVYKSDLPGGKHLAVKVFNNPITHTTFEREMAHLNEAASQVSTLLPIRGYFSNPIEKAIFYDFMPRGTLHDVLQDAPTLLDWPKRINIALGIAQALAHLHKGSHFRTLHKDLKSSNVLLNDSLCPLVGDYGLIELVSKALVLTPGYTPPEFMSISSSSTKRYTEKTDVYNFGVVLLELLTSKSPVFHIELDTEMHLVTWVLGLQKEGKKLDVLDAFILESCPSIDHPIQTLNLALLCLNDEPTQRPTMYEITSILERLVSMNSPMKDTPHQLKRPLLK